MKDLNKSVEQLSQEEKINLVKGSGNWHTNDLLGKLPSIHLSDGPHGLRAQSENAKSNNDSIIATCFPTASASACSFDRMLIYKMADAIAKEAKAAGVSVLLGPGVNMKRSPLCGRNFEYFSEDPYLSGELAVSYVNGVQDNGIATSLKHFAGNSQETHRMTSNSQIDERALREIYLRAFEKVVKDAKPATVMASYNLLNGLPACENKWLLTDVLRNEWGFNGLVMSDWGACVDTGACIEAGMDLEMPDSYGNHRTDIIDALSSGKLSITALDRAASKVCELVDKYSNDDYNGLKEIPESILLEHYELAKMISEKSAVLLKNDGLLPLDNPSKIIIVGSLAEYMRVQGGGSSHIRTNKLSSILDAFNSCGIETEYYKGYDCNAKDTTNISESDKQLLNDAISGVKKAVEKDSSVPIIIFGGLTDTAEGEGYDRDTMLLPYNQRVLFTKIKEITHNIVYVSFGGSPYDMSDIIYAKSILSMYLGGEGTADSTVDILLGKTNPSGRLAETWPLSIEDTPCFKDFGHQNITKDDVAYKESLFIGYRYYDTFGIPVRFPFGHGLSYSSFKYENMEVVHDSDIINVKVDVTNTGNMAAQETVLVFVRNPEGDFIRAKRELRGFDKISLEAGMTKTVNILLDDRAFEIYDVKTGSYLRVSGEYHIEISKSVGDVILSETINITDGVVPCSERDILPSYFADSNDKDRFKKDEFRVLYGRPLTDLSNIKPGEFTAKNSLLQMAPYSFMARLLLKVGKTAARLLTGSPADDPETMMVYESISEGNIDSVCNQSGGIISRKMIYRVIKQANSKGKING